MRQFFLFFNPFFFHLFDIKTAQKSVLVAPVIAYLRKPQFPSPSPHLPNQTFWRIWYWNWWEKRNSTKDDLFVLSSYFWKEMNVTSPEGIFICFCWRKKKISEFWNCNYPASSNEFNLPEAIINKVCRATRGDVKFPITWQLEEHS